MPFETGLLDEFGNLVGTYEQKLNNMEDSYLLFKFPGHPLGTLKIRTGANSIKWSYELNTSVTPTVGGEVIQILSCFVGPMRIEGMTAGVATIEHVDNQAKLTTPKGWGNRDTPADEMEEIIDWFRIYMHKAGAIDEKRVKRDEKAIHFLYPRRGWDFYIQVTRLDGFAMNRETVAVPWGITAEVVSDNGLEFMEASTMNTFTDALVGRDALYHAVTTGYEFMVNPFVNPSLDHNVLNATLIKQMGDNFQDLVAAWNSGDFDHYGYSSVLLSTDKNRYTKDIGGEHFTDAYEVYTEPKWFRGPGEGGGYFLGTGPLNDYGGGAVAWADPGRGPGSGGGGLPGDGGGGGGGDEEIGCGANECQIVNRINALFEAAGMPGKLGVATSIYESGLRPEAANSGGHVGLFQNNVKGTGRASVPQAITDLWYAHPNDDPLVGACKAYPIDMQITQASQWFPRYKPDSIGDAPYTDAELHHWATCAQGVGGSPCDPNNSQFSLTTFTGYLRKAEQLIARCGGTEEGEEDPVGKKAKLRDYVIRSINNEPIIHYSQFRPMNHFGVEPEEGFTCDCSAFTTGAYYYVDAPDPNHAGYNGSGYTGTQINNPRVTNGQYEIGDLALYGDSFGDTGHVTICYREGNASGSLWGSHGSEGGPLSATLMYRSDFLCVVRPGL